KYCKIYNKFGKCHKGSKCPDLHDPEKVSVCTRFLRGSCTITNCPFSHKVTKDKMPTCIHYLRGMCVRVNCPYNHVNVGQSAEICRDFLAGHCSMGDQCKKKHILVCPDFSQTGSCFLANNCPMRHVRRKQKRSENSFKNRSPGNVASKKDVR
ncbi:hypothetical protein HELRODRAFT_88438, partial [Helobdella robusta]|uniref:Zinc finger CCCH domain-containing protein 3 n=1 Tax=Helobdella robusta TaxID=6412 RepID=T1G725_HELRO